MVFSRKLGKVEIFGKGEHPEIFRVTSIRRRTRRRSTSAARSTGTSTAAPTTSRSWRRCSAPMRSPSQAARQSSPAVRRLRAPRRRREGADRRCARGAHDRGVAAALQQGPVPRGGRALAHAPGQGAPARVATPVGAPVARARSHHRSRRDGPRRRARLLDDLLGRATTPDRVYRHEWQVGDS